MPLHESPFYTFNQNAHLHSNCLKWDIVTLLWSYCRDFCTLKFCDYENNFFFIISNCTSFSCAHKIYTTYLYMLPRIQNTLLLSICIPFSGLHVYCTRAINQCTGSWSYTISPVTCQGIKSAFKTCLYYISFAASGLGRLLIGGHVCFGFESVCTPCSPMPTTVWKMWISSSHNFPCVSSSANLQTEVFSFMQPWLLICVYMDNIWCFSTKLSTFSEQGFDGIQNKLPSFQLTTAEDLFWHHLYFVRH